MKILQQVHAAAITFVLPACLFCQANQQICSLTTHPSAVSAVTERCWPTTAGGVLPNIHQVLLPAKKKHEKSSGAKSQEF